MLELSKREIFQVAIPDSVSFNRAMIKGVDEAKSPLESVSPFSWILLMTGARVSTDKAVIGLPKEEAFMPPVINTMERGFPVPTFQIDAD